MDNATAKAFATLLGWLAIAAGIGGTWYVQGERIKVLQENYGALRGDVDDIREKAVDDFDELKTMIGEVQRGQAVSNTKLDALKERIEQRWR